MNKSDFDLGSLLRTIRLRKGFSLRELEARTGVSNAYLSQIETGKAKTPSPRILRSLAEVLDHSYTELMTSAGHLTTVITETYQLRFGKSSIGLEDLSIDDRQRVINFVLQLKAKKDDK